MKYFTGKYVEIKIKTMKYFINNAYSVFGDNIDRAKNWQTVDSASNRSHIKV